MNQWRSQQVCRMCGITYRMLDYWLRNGVIPGVWDLGSGQKRLLGEKELEMVWACSQVSGWMVEGRNQDSKKTKLLSWVALNVLHNTVESGDRLVVRLPDKVERIYFDDKIPEGPYPMLVIQLKTWEEIVAQASER